MYSIHYAKTEIPRHFRRSKTMTPARFPVTIEQATKTYRSLLKNVGANARINHMGEWVFNSDKVDQRVIKNVIDGTGEGITYNGNRVHYMNPEQVGGYPPMKQSEPYQDTDHDGMSDAWEKKYQFNEEDPSDNHSDPDGDGYTNIEEFLNGTNPRKTTT